MQPIGPSPAPGLHRPVLALYAIFFVSGFCGLIYESIWSHYLKLLLGHAAYAQAVVLVVFVGGLAVGAWTVGRFSERLRHPILLYAAVEAAVAVIAFSFQRVFESASAWATSSFLPAMCGEPGACAASWLLATALILPASVLLGTTFPLMSAGVLRSGVGAGRGLGLLYFLNSAGAALGVVGAGFFLIPALGLPGTMLLAGGLNFVVAVAAFVVWRIGAIASTESTAVAAPASQADRTELRLLLLVAALTGLSSFIYEVVWIRMLTLVFGAATHSFELMLAPFIFGLALGAWWIRNRIDSAANVVRLLGTIQVAMGLLAVATLPLYAGLYDVMAFVLRTLTRTEASYAVFNVVTGLMAAAVMLPATICAGMTLPLITAILLRGGHGERRIGQVYGINTFGAIAGVLLAIHLLVPALGLKWALGVGAAIDVVLGFALWTLANRARSAGAGSAQTARFAAVALACAALLVAVPLFSPIGVDKLASGVFRTGQARFLAEDTRAIFHRDGKTATVSVLETVDGVRSLLTNGKPDGATHPQRRKPTDDDQTMVLLGALGPLHHPEARRAAVIGLGTGTSSSVLLQAPGLEAVDTIEIEPMVIEAAQLFRPRSDAVFDDARSRIIIDDARAHFSKTRSRYDIIVSEPSNPWVSGVSGLFTTEFYRHVAAHLAPDGVFVQWLHLYEASPQVVGSIVRAFAGVFPEFSVYGTNNLDIVLVARNDRKPAVLSPGVLERMPALRAQLAQVGIDGAAMLAAHSAGPSGPIRLLANSYGAPPNSDYFPYVDNRAASDRFQGLKADALFTLTEAPLPFMEFPAGSATHAGSVRQAAQRMPHNVRLAAAGLHGLRFLQGQALRADEEVHLSGYATEFALTRSWLHNCSLPRDAGPAWNAVVRAAALLSMGAPPGELASFWAGASKRCGRTISPVQAAWLDLFAATAARDAAAVRQPALKILDEDKQLTPESRAYATLAAVSALLTAGDRQAAARVMVEQRRLLPEAQMETPWFRYLVLVLSTPQGAAQR